MPVTLGLEFELQTFSDDRKKDYIFDYKVRSQFPNTF